MAIQKSLSKCHSSLAPFAHFAFVAGTAVAVVAASPVLAEDKYVFGVCQVSRPASGAEIRPVTDGGSYLFNYHGDDPRYKAGLSSGQFFAGAKVTLVKAPTHGKVVLVDDSHAIAWNWYHYTPQAGYVGQDRFVMQVDKNGVKVRIQYLIESMNADEPSIGYCDPETWKISGDTNLANVLTVASQRAKEGQKGPGSIFPEIEQCNGGGRRYLVF